MSVLVVSVLLSSDLVESGSLVDFAAVVLVDVGVNPPKIPSSAFPVPAAEPEPESEVDSRSPVIELRKSDRDRFVEADEVPATNEDAMTSWLVCCGAVVIVEF